MDRRYTLAVVAPTLDRHFLRRASCDMPVKDWRYMAYRPRKPVMDRRYTLAVVAPTLDRHFLRRASCDMPVKDWRYMAYRPRKPVMDRRYISARRRRVK